MKPPFKILNEHEKKQIREKLNEQFGITEIKGLLLKRGEDRIFLFQGDIDEKKIREIENEFPVERIGIYFAKVSDTNRSEQNGEIRLSLEGVYILRKQITKNIFNLDKKQAEEWMLGQELPIATEKHDFLAMKYKDYFLGCGKASAEKIGNFIPKNRRLKYKEN